MKRVLWLLLLVVLCPLRGQAAPLGQDAPIEIQGEASYTFGSQIAFRATLPPEIAAQSPQVFVFWQAQGQIATNQAEMLPVTDGEYQHQAPLAAGAIRPFAEVRYWFRLRFPDGSNQESVPQTFRYADNRYQWQTLESAPFQVHWYEGDLDFGQALLDEAQRALQASRNWLSLPPQDTIHIYAYASASEVQSALQLSGYNWVAGHADPALNVILVALPPGIDQRYEIGRQIPHELMHILLYHKLGPDAAPLPAWLDEGLASNAEHIVNPDYAWLLQDTYARDALLPLSDLCAAFPRDAASALLSYAEAQSFTAYLHAQYGRSGMEALLNAYADGLACERAPQVALGKSLSQLERAWIQTELAHSIWATLREMYPYLLLLGIIILVPLLALWRYPPPEGA